VTAAIACVFYNYGFTLFLAICLAISEWLGGNKKIKQSAIYEVIINFLRHSLNKK
jgi:hypothetical protein